MRSTVRSGIAGKREGWGVRRLRESSIFFFATKNAAKQEPWRCDVVITGYGIGGEGR